MGRWRHNGERAYYDTTSPLKRMRTWLVWIGGWEHPWNDRDGRRYSTYFSTRYPDGTRAGPTPISLFGHRITFYGWGLDIRLWARPKWHLVVSRYVRRFPPRIYISPDGTPPRPGERGIRVWPRNVHYWH